MQKDNIGFLFEISPWGTGFIEEIETHRVFGFHHSMILGYERPVGANWPDLLEQRKVSFSEEAGTVATVRFAEAAMSA